jgi:hypothetical protein
MNQLPPMLVRTLSSMQLEASAQAALTTLLSWAFGLEGTLAMGGLAKVASVLEALDRLQLLPGETEEERQKIKATISARLLG